MINFSWTIWVASICGLKPRSRLRKIKSASISSLEGLEDRALLAASPIAVDDTYADTLGTAYLGSSVLANDTADAPGGTTIQSATLGTTTAHGILSLSSDGTFAYVPDLGFTGSDSFTYFAIDSLNQISANEGTATIHVGNSIPTGLPATISTGVDTAFSGNLLGLDLDGDSLTFGAGTTAPSDGSVTIQPDGSFTYTPTTGFDGVD
ncbi:MAG: repeat-containing protein, partial [Planctomycetaceae bacterium]|nr:repeat-containing protein [Planctomycetaceae bacterium]